MSKNQSYDKKIFRLMSILNKLNAGERVHSAEMAKEFNVSVRSVQRDIEMLNQTQFPVVSFKKGVYSFMEGFSLKKMSLTDEEASLLTFFNEIADSLGKNFSDSFRGLVSKMLARKEESPFYVKLPEIHGQTRNFPFVKELERAVSDCRKVVVHYEKDKRTEACRVCPLKLINFEGFWYLLAMPEGTKEFRKFRAEKIKGLEMLEEDFEPPKNIKSILDRSVNIWFNEQPGEQIKLTVDSLTAHYFRKKTYFPDQKIIQEKKNGSIVLETRANFNEVMRVIVHWIPHIHVVAPKALDKEVRTLLAAYLKNKK